MSYWEVVVVYCCYCLYVVPCSCILSNCIAVLCIAVIRWETKAPLLRWRIPTSNLTSQRMKLWWVTQRPHRVNDTYFCNPTFFPVGEENIVFYNVKCGHFYVSRCLAITFNLSFLSDYISLDGVEIIFLGTRVIQKFGTMFCYRYLIEIGFPDLLFLTAMSLVVLCHCLLSSTILLDNSVFSSTAYIDLVSSFSLHFMAILSNRTLKNCIPILLSCTHSLIHLPSFYPSSSLLIPGSWTS